MIYAKEYAASIIDAFDDFLTDKNVDIPNDDKIGDEYEAAIFGEDFDRLIRTVVEVIEDLCEEAGVDVDTERWSK